MKHKKDMSEEFKKINEQTKKTLAEIEKMSPEERAKLRRIANGFAAKCKSQGV